MKRAALLAVLLAFAPFALAQDKKDADAVLPLDPLAGAKDGDWTVFRCILTAPGRKETHVQSWKVVGADEKTVKIAQQEGEDGPIEHAEFAAKVAPTIAKYFGIKDEKVIDVEKSDEKKTACGREFACKKVTFKTDDGQRKLRCTAWLSTDVKGSGVVAIHFESDIPGKAEKVCADFELAGFGSKDKTELGKTRGELAKELAAEKPDDEKK